MPEYIEREALVKKLNEAPACFDSGDIRYGIDIATSEAIKQPAADVVEVVRCKDCKYCKYLLKDNLLKDKMICIHKGNQIFGTAKPTFANNFCNYGERKVDVE